MVCFVRPCSSRLNNQWQLWRFEEVGEVGDGAGWEAVGLLVPLLLPFSIKYTTFFFILFVTRLISVPLHASKIINSPFLRGAYTSVLYQSSDGKVDGGWVRSRIFYFIIFSLNDRSQCWELMNDHVSMGEKAQLAGSAASDSAAVAGPRSADSARPRQQSSCCCCCVDGSCMMQLCQTCCCVFGLQSGTQSIGLFCFVSETHIVSNVDYIFQSCQTLAVFSVISNGKSFFSHVQH